MTANELADLLIVVDALRGNVVVTEAAIMLRQQQAEIEALKPYKEKIEEMERRYDDHFRKALGK